MPGSVEQEGISMDNETTIIRLSGKFGKKIGWIPEHKTPMHENPYLDWSAHLFRAPRTEYVLITNTASLYSAIVYGRGITDENQFLKRAIRSIDDMLEDDGFQLIFKRIIAPALGKYDFCKALNRTVIGSMNDLVRMAKRWLADGELSPYRVAMKLNETPFSYLDYQFPKEAFQRLQVVTKQVEE